MNTPRTLIWDLLALAGAALTVYGLALVYAPLAWIVPGAALLSFGVWGAYRCS